MKTSCHVVTGVGLAFSTFEEQSVFSGTHEDSTSPASQLQMPVMLFWLFSLKKAQGGKQSRPQVAYREGKFNRKKKVEVAIVQME